MNAVSKSWQVLRAFGPRIVWLRARGYLDKATGATKRHNPLRPWESISPAEMWGEAAPADVAKFAEHKKKHLPTFLFALGQPPNFQRDQGNKGGDMVSPGGMAAAAGSHFGARETCLPTNASMPLRFAQNNGGLVPPTLEQRIKLLAENRVTYFFASATTVPLNWYENTLTNGHGVADRAWYEIPDFRPESGDTRTMWEPCRAAWAIDLARAKAHRVGTDNNADAAAIYWRFVDSWMQACPPFRGSQWKCGQEAAVRLIALTIGFWATHASDTPASRWLDLARIAWITGTRIVHHIGYAVSQKNNHALSEAVGLMLVAYLFPEFRNSTKWRLIGRRVLAQEMRRQIYADGSYVQHSMNYHRVMLNVCTLGLRIAELESAPFERDLYDQLGAAAEFAFQMMEPATGQLPNYGNNDGALVLPLSDCDFTDFRPAIQSAYFAAHRKPLLPPGPWDEETAWLFGTTANPAVKMPTANVHTLTSSAFSAGGYYTLRAEESWAMVRCHTYRDRQTQLDTLHLDLWWRGLNVLCDSGTYQYFTPNNPALERYFKSVAGHNVVELDGRDPAELVSRFLWLPWSKARERRFEAGEQILCFEGESADYDRGGRGVLWRRTVVCLPLGTWMIVDDLLGTGDHGVILRWHMIDAPYSLDESGNTCRLQTSAGDFTIAISAGKPSTAQTLAIHRNVITPERVQGVASRYYGHIMPAPTFEFATWDHLPMRIVTTAGPNTSSATRIEENADSEIWQFRDAGESTHVRLGPCSRQATQIYLGGA